MKTDPDLADYIAYAVNLNYANVSQLQGFQKVRRGNRFVVAPEIVLYRCIVAAYIRETEEPKKLIDNSDHDLAGMLGNPYVHAHDVGKDIIDAVMAYIEPDINEMLSHAAKT